MASKMTYCVRPRTSRNQTKVFDNTGWYNKLNFCSFILWVWAFVKNRLLNWWTAINMTTSASRKLCLLVLTVHQDKGQIDSWRSDINTDPASTRLSEVLPSVSSEHSSICRERELDNWMLWWRRGLWRCRDTQKFQVPSRLFHISFIFLKKCPS